MGFTPPFLPSDVCWDGWPSGLRRTIGNRVGSRPRGFESHPVRFGSSELYGTHDILRSSGQATWVGVGLWVRGVAQSGRALRSGRRGPRFESGRPDGWCWSGLRRRRRARIVTASAEDDPGFFGVLERWQNGYCTRLESERPKGLGGSNPSRSVGVSLLGQTIWGAFFVVRVGERGQAAGAYSGLVRLMWLSVKHYIYA